MHPLAGAAISLVSLLALWILLDLERSWNLIKGANYHLFAAALAVNMAANVFAAERFRHGIGLFQRRVSTSWAVRVHFAGFFCNQILPTGLGGDVIRFMALRPLVGSVRSLRAVFFDRTFGILFMLVVASAMFPILLFDPPPATGLWSWAVTAPLALTSIYAGFELAKQPLARRFRAHRLVKFAVMAGRDLAKGFALPKAQWLWVHGLLFLAASIFAYFLTALAFGTIVPARHFLWAVPIIFVLMQFPLSYGGWGPREAAALLVFSELESDAERVAVIAAGFGIVMMLSATPGLTALAGAIGYRAWRAARTISTK